MSAARPSDALRARVLGAIAKEPLPAKTPRWLVVVLALGAVLVFVATSRTMHGDERPRALVIATSTAALLAGMVVTRGVAGRWPSDRPSMLPPDRSRLVALVLGALAALVGIALAARIGAGAFAESDVVALKGHVACGVLFVVQGLLPLAVLVVPRRGLDPLSPPLTGAALGAAAGVWAGMLAWIRCPHVDLAHGVLAHALPVLVLAAIGAAVGGRLVRMR